MAKNQERRSISAALNFDDSALAFIKGGGETPSVLAPKTIQTAAPSAHPAKKNLADEVTVQADQSNYPESVPVRRSSTSKNRQNAVNHSFPGMANLLVPLTTRLSPSTAAALKRAGLEQKLNGAEPSTVQQIAEIAIQQWLQKNGFLG